MALKRLKNQIYYAKLLAKSFDTSYVHQEKIAKIDIHKINNVFIAERLDTELPEV